MSITNLLLICLCIVGSVHGRSASELKTLFMAEAMKCTQEYSLTPEEISQMHNKLIVPESRNGKCFLACFFKKRAWINDKGMVDMETAHAMAEKEHIEDTDLREKSKKMFNECLSVNDEPVKDGEKGCDRAGLLAKCLVEKLPKYNIKISSIV